MKTVLPKSPRRVLAEIVHQKIGAIVRKYDDEADIVVKGWTAKISDIVDEKVKRLGICVSVKEAELSALEDVAETEYKALVKVTIESSPEYQSGKDGHNSWDADDLADVIAKEVGSGWLFQQDIAFAQYREIVVSGCKGKVSGLRKTVELTLKTCLSL